MDIIYILFSNKKPVNLALRLSISNKSITIYRYFVGKIFVADLRQSCDCLFGIELATASLVANHG